MCETVGKCQSVNGLSASASGWLWKARMSCMAYNEQQDHAVVEACSAQRALVNKCHEGEEFTFCDAMFWVYLLECSSSTHFSYRTS